MSILDPYEIARKAREQVELSKQRYEQQKAVENAIELAERVREQQNLSKQRYEEKKAEIKEKEKKRNILITAGVIALVGITIFLIKKKNYFKLNK